jgi:hypothetical protein
VTMSPKIKFIICRVTRFEIFESRIKGWGPCATEGCITRARSAHDFFGICVAGCIPFAPLFYVLRPQIGQFRYCKQPVKHTLVTNFAFIAKYSKTKFKQNLKHLDTLLLTKLYPNIIVIIEYNFTWRCITHAV